ncbi:MAG: 3-oxoacyl-[acyl-carrier-protein] reductase FabG [Myxococcota bacterium]|nr:3-oxoacyl-[acyl-carrier-protein] reductase FabG [Myxococcota bacterium]
MTDNHSRPARIALVTGANRGIGREVCRQLAQKGAATVLMTARNAELGEAAAAELRKEGLDVRFHPLDVTDDNSAKALAAWVRETSGKLDILVNNAGGDFDDDQFTLSPDMDRVRALMELHLYGPWRLIAVLLPLLRQAESPRIVNVSSEAGSFGAGYGMRKRGLVLPGYCISKAALNALTVKTAVALKNEGFLVNAVCPGFTATYPGLDALGARPVAEGAAGVVWAALLPDAGPTGGFFRDGQPLEW